MIVAHTPNHLDSNNVAVDGSMLGAASAEGQHDAARERSLGRKITAAWALLVVNVLPYAKLNPTIGHLPHSLTRIVAQASLGLALVMALWANHHLIVRRNAYLALLFLSGATALLTSLEVGTFHMDLRCVRLIAFAVVLLLLTPWFGRRDMLLAKVHLKCMVAVVLVVVLGAILSPHKGYVHGRLEGDIWPISASDVAHYAAVAAGISIIMFLSGVLDRRRTAVIAVLSLSVLLLTHTRTGLAALVIALFVSLLSLVTWRRHARQVMLLVMVIVIPLGIANRTAVGNWWSRGQTNQQYANLTGRTVVWQALLEAPRTESQKLFGAGITNAGFQGRPIDSSWLATYEQQGLLGDLIQALIFLVLLALAATRPRSPARAVALLLVVYTLVSSYTETAFGDPTLYLLDLGVAASLLAPNWNARLEPRMLES